MVYKRSEYGREFKVSSLVKNIPVYKDHLSYRHLRRERECAHTPISWDGDVVTESSDSEEKLTPEEEVEKLPISELVITEEDEVDENTNEGQDGDEEDDIAKEKREAKARDMENEKAKMTSSCDVDIVKQDEALLQSAKAKLNKYASKNNQEKPGDKKEIPEKKFLGKTFLKPKVVEEKVFVKRKPRRPDRLGKLPKCRPQSAPSFRPKSAASEKVQDKGSKAEPFMNYGGGAVDRSLGDKKTFNVRASSAVYPAALRAQKRNLLMIEKQIERQKSASAREKRRKAKFNEQMMRETALWQSEYRRSFPAYENTEYKTSEREPRKQKSHFAA